MVYEEEELTPEELEGPTAAAAREAERLRLEKEQANRGILEIGQNFVDESYKLDEAAEQAVTAFSGGGRGRRHHGSGLLVLLLSRLLPSRLCVFVLLCPCALGPLLLFLLLLLVLHCVIFVGTPFDPVVVNHDRCNES